MKHIVRSIMHRRAIICVRRAQRLIASDSESARDVVDQLFSDYPPAFLRRMM